MLRRPKQTKQDTSGFCLESRLSIAGAGLTNLIGGVLLRFREKQIAVTGDVGAMYHQVQVPGNQSRFIWFLKWMDSDNSKVFVDHK